MADHFRTGVDNYGPGDLIVSHPSAALNGVFERSVVLITENFRGNVSGVVVNKQIGLTDQELLAKHGITTSSGPRQRVYCGGPVNQNSLMLLHTPDWRSRNTMQVTRTLSLSSDMEMLHRFAEGKRPKHYMWIAGISGWAPGQLAAEASGEGIWGEPQWIELSTDYADKIVWHTPVERKWITAVESYSKTVVDSWI